MQTASFNLEQATISGCTLGEVLGSLSYALDLTEGQEPGHCVRSCFIGTRISEKLGLSSTDAADLYYTLLLKDLGCSSNAARICQLYLTDDHTFKHGSKTIDGSVKQAIAFVLRHTATDEPMMRRAKTVFDVLRSADELVKEIYETRCQAGADIARQMRFSNAVAEGIAGLDEHWNGGGRPYRLVGEDIPLFSRIALLAQVMEVFFRAAGPDAALSEIQQRSGTWFDPQIVRAAMSCARDPGFWEALAAPDIESRVFSMEPAQDALSLDDDLLDDIVKAFARVIDAKSPFTHGHSERVAHYTGLLAEELSLGRTTQRWMWRTALMHDIGKLGVSNRILDKKGKLTEEEFEVIKRHPVMSQTILNHVRPFRPMAWIAAAHHERLDGKGYPYGLSAEALTQEMRILTVADIFDALSAARPYKPALPLEEVHKIMEKMVGTAIDGEILQALWDVAERR
ncbi:HD-GYP domain-containing protein [Roseovarius sp. D0-M9]|uniref:HD-GYP domain-containing protein n=1 Tax=Roseovarius sp. D0-M9 TaxID=3127117 RepID=UPI0030105640